jgi:orotidine-5'-phosphate decarboxylase
VVGIVKPQVAFFERFGSTGIAALEDVLAEARAAGLIVIADGKRGDIGSTMDAYAQAWLTPGSPLEADALTVSPYLGVGSLAGTFSLACDAGKGVFVLAATSNPEGNVIQRALPQSGVFDGTAVRPRGTTAKHIIDEVALWNSGRPAAPLADIGYVIGATVDQEGYGLPSQIAPPAPILAPGFGHQGATPRDLARIFGNLAACVIASESRSILEAGPTRLGAVIEARASEYRGIRA